jgi:hypothetical protein
LPEIEAIGDSLKMKTKKRFNPPMTDAELFAKGITDATMRAERSQARVLRRRISASWSGEGDVHETASGFDDPNEFQEWGM